MPFDGFATVELGELTPTSTVLESMRRQLEGVLEQEYEDAPPTGVVDSLGRVRGTVVTGRRRGAIIGTSPSVPTLATRADLERAGLGIIGEQAARLLDGMATTTYRAGYVSPMQAGADGTALARMTTVVTEASAASILRRPYGGLRDITEVARAALGFDVDVEVSAVAGDGVVRVTITRADAGALTAAEIRAARVRLRRVMPVAVRVDVLTSDVPLWLRMTARTALDWMIRRARRGA
ncbi:MAG: hypothetical protein Q8S73_43040 [Deltaproteobacteria bacterium]|nr:hypothetical protein [Deltaproteobacteria bacterium]